MNPTHDPKKCISLFDFCETVNKILEEEHVLDMGVLEHGYMKCMDNSIPDARKCRLTSSDFTIETRVVYGSNEGIFVDIYLSGRWQSDQKEDGRLWIGCYKTLGEGRIYAEAMGKLAGAINYFAHKFVNEHIDDFTGFGKN